MDYMKYYLVAQCIIDGFLFVAWQKSNFLNLSIKALLFFLMCSSVLFVMNIN